MAARRDNDERLLRMLFDDHASALLGYALRLTNGDRGLAEDIVQGTFLRAWRHPASLTPEQGLARRWLLTVARRIAVDDHRARAARPIEVGDEVLSVLPSGEDQIDCALQAWLVADALSTLSHAHREVLVETYYRGRTVDEVAGVIGVPAGTVKSRTHYALTALRVALRERGVVP